MTAFVFAKPWILTLLWIVPAAAAGLAALRRRRRRQQAAWVAEGMRDRMLPRTGFWRFAVQLALLSTAFILAILALARPCWGTAETTLTRRGRDLMIVLDVSRSMLATDVAPNRLERAKTDLIDLVAALEGDRAGLLLFRHKAVEVCPLTTDTGFLLQMLDAAAPDAAPPGETDLGDAIHKALDALERQASAHPAIVLVTDGEDLAAQAETAANRARALGVTLFTVGYGSPSGAGIPDPNGGEIRYHGQPVLSKLDAAALSRLASATGGVFIPVGTARADLGNLYRRHLSRLAARDYETSVTRLRLERFPIFLLPAVLLVLSAAALSNGQPRLRTGRSGATPTAAILALIVLPALLKAGDAPPATFASAPARQGQSLYRQGRYEEAAAAFRQAAAGSAETWRNRYNEGCALASAGRHREAAAVFQSLRTAPRVIAARARYNEGCALIGAADDDPHAATNAAAADARAATLEAAAQAFYDVLQIDGHPLRAEAERNLALAARLAQEARQDAHRLRLQETYGHRDASQLALHLLDGQRAVAAEASEALAKPPPDQIRQFEKAAAAQRELAELVPLFADKWQRRLHEAAAQGDTNAAAHVPHAPAAAQALGNWLSAAAERLQDADPEATAMLPNAEAAAYAMWKALAPFDQLIREDIRAQSNVWRFAQAAHPTTPPPADVTSVRSGQSEARTLTGLFIDRFAAAVPETGLPPPETPASGTATTSPPTAGLTPETRARILELAGQTATMQHDADAALQEEDWGAAATLGRESLDRLQEIERLLPRQDSPDPSPSSQKSESKPDSSPQDDASPSSPSQDDENTDTPTPPTEPEPKLETDPQETARDMAEEEARALLERAKRRETEYRDLIQKRFHLDRAPSERDW